MNGWITFVYVWCISFFFFAEDVTVQCKKYNAKKRKMVYGVAKGSEVFKLLSLFFITWNVFIVAYNCTYTRTPPLASRALEYYVDILYIFTPMAYAPCARHHGCV
jgi:hypothetical protein